MWSATSWLKSWAISFLIKLCTSCACSGVAVLPVPIAQTGWAAGGILRRRAQMGDEIVIVHRSRYGGEWCLPKGKPDAAKDKTWTDVALREVKEETGCSARITSFAGTVSYLVNSTPKVVLFWNMELVGECAFTPSQEVDSAVWVSFNEAIERLRHSREKELLIKAVNSTAV